MTIIIRLIFFILLGNIITGCGTLTGIPSHGGGKRFAVEQELVSASARAAIKELDLTAIQGRKVNLLVNAIGDLGSGNLLGGRFSVISQLRGDYIQTPTQTDKRTYPRYTETTTSESSTQSSSKAFGQSETQAETSTQSFPENDSNSESSVTSSQGSENVSKSSSKSTTDTMSIAPSTIQSQQKGGGGQATVGVEFNGLGTYTNSTDIVSDDLQYLTALIQTYLYLRGVWIVPPSEAEIDVYVTVDVFGTVRSRIEWFLANNEILRAKTSLEVLAVDSLNGRLVMPPQVVGSEAEYNEQYILWAGPIMIRKSLKHGDPLLTDYTGIMEEQTETKPVDQMIDVPYPFQHQIENYGNTDDKEKASTP